MAFSTDDFSLITSFDWRFQPCCEQSLRLRLPRYAQRKAIRLVLNANMWFQPDGLQINSEAICSEFS